MAFSGYMNFKLFWSCENFSLSFEISCVFWRSKDYLYGHELHSDFLDVLLQYWGPMKIYIDFPVTFLPTNNHLYCISIEMYKKISFSAIFIQEQEIAQNGNFPIFQILIMNTPCRRAEKAKHSSAHLLYWIHNIVFAWAAVGGSIGVVAKVL